MEQALETMWQQDLHQIPSWSRAAEESAIEQARNGVYEPLVTLLLPRVTGWVEHYYLTHWIGTSRLEMLDLVGVANLSLVEKVPTALQRPNPGAYLMTVASGAVREYCQSWHTLIRTPTRGVIGMEVQSLDAPAFFTDWASDGGPTRSGRVAYAIQQEGPSQPKRDMAPLYDAIRSQFTAGSQHLLARLFGLFGEQEASMEELAGGDYRSPAYQSVKTRKCQMLRRLRMVLKNHYPELVASGPAHRQMRVYDSIVLTEAQRRRLDIAYQTLEKQGKRISMISMIRESRLNNMYVLAYLYGQQERKLS